MGRARRRRRRAGRGGSRPGRSRCAASGPTPTRSSSLRERGPAARLTRANRSRTVPRASSDSARRCRPAAELPPAPTGPSRCRQRGGRGSRRAHCLLVVARAPNRRARNRRGAGSRRKSNRRGAAASLPSSSRDACASCLAWEPVPERSRAKRPRPEGRGRCNERVVRRRRTNRSARPPPHELDEGARRNAGRTPRNSHQVGLRVGRAGDVEMHPRILLRELPEEHSGGDRPACPPA